MRGRTFGDAFIVIDEAQNMTVRKMRMVVTRLGRGARMVITGDPTQIELHEDEPSGLPHLLQLLAGKDLAYIHEFKDPHVTRDSIAARLEALYQSAGSTRMRVA
jgi:phosphate starvation-inducible PhoH-like protein